MKKNIILTLLFTAALAACSDDDSRFRGNFSNVYINGHASANKSAQEKMTVHEILLKGNLTLAAMLYINPQDSSLTTGFGCGFGLNHPILGECDDYYKHNIDTVNDRLIMLGSYIIENEQLYQYGGVFLKGRNYILEWHNDPEDWAKTDTVGYIPNSVIEAAQIEILDLWKEGKIDEMYEVFNNSFYFIPCTGEEFRTQIKERVDYDHYLDHLKAEHEFTHEIRW